MRREVRQQVTHLAPKNRRAASRIFITFNYSPVMVIIGDWASTPAAANWRPRRQRRHKRRSSAPASRPASATVLAPIRVAVSGSLQATGIFAVRRSKLNIPSRGSIVTPRHQILIQALFEGFWLRHIPQQWGRAHTCLGCCVLRQCIARQVTARHSRQHHRTAAYLQSDIGGEPLAPPRAIGARLSPPRLTYRDPNRIVADIDLKSSQAPGKVTYRRFCMQFLRQ